MISYDAAVRPKLSSAEGPCPTYFRACCAEASRGRTSGGAVVGYDHPAYHLTIHLEDERPYEVDEIDWQEAIEELVEFIHAGADLKIAEWYLCWLPRCMAIVPRRRHKKFVAGVYQAAVYQGWIDRVPFAN